jgi:hypothetical protein
MGVLGAFRAPIVIMFSWMIFIIGVLGATHLIGAKLPVDGPAGGLGDLFRNA